MARSHGAGGRCLCLPEGVDRGEPLAVEIVLLEDIGVDEAQIADPETGEKIGRRAAESAAADDADPGTQQSELLRAAQTVAQIAGWHEVEEQGLFLDLGQ